jgi:SAM-dependent methyltransferase
MHLVIRQRHLASLLRDFGVPIDDATLAKIAHQQYAEALLKHLGADAVESVDASDYEGATVIHDMNEPVPDGLAGRFSAIIDHGTLEHIFDFPAAMRNVDRMLAINGHFLSATCANNFMGHGFYQFSPELYFRLFDEARGFRLLGVFLVQVESRCHWYRVTDPAIVHERVELRNSQPTYIIVIAQKTRAVAELRSPQQSDYARAWNGVTAPTATHPLKALIKRRFPRICKLAGNLIYRVQFGYRGRRGFAKPYFSRFQAHLDSL